MGLHAEVPTSRSAVTRAAILCNVPFHVTSHDWQKSDRLFAAIMNNFNSNSQMGAIEVGGRGTFDGVLTKEFRAPAD